MTAAADIRAALAAARLARGYVCTGQQERHLGILRSRLAHWVENDGPWGAFDHAVRNLIRTVLLEYGEGIDLPTDIPLNGNGVLTLDPKEER